MAVGRKLQLARDICAGMAALHSRGILHLDLKPANVLISRAGEALVADFGLSLQLRTTLTGASLAASALATAAGARGTMAYKAPELSRPKRKGGAVYAKPCDVYSFAMLLRAPSPLPLKLTSKSQRLPFVRTECCSQPMSTSPPH